MNHVLSLDSDLLTLNSARIKVLQIKEPGLGKRSLWIGSQVRLSSFSYFLMPPKLSFVTLYVH